MINYEFKIDIHDGNGLRKINSNPIQGNSDVRILGEELDSGFLILWLKNKDRLPIMSYLEYTISDDTNSLTKGFYIGRDEVNTLSKNGKYFQHNIELIETTKKLEKFLLGTICFTQPTEKNKINYTLNDCLQRIMRIYPLGKDENIEIDVNDYSTYPIPENRIINAIDPTLSQYLKKIEAPQFVFNNPTLKEAIDGILKYVNAVTRLKKDYRQETTYYYDIIGAEFYGYLKSLIDIKDNYNFSSSQSIEDYASTTKSFVKNMSIENINSNGQYIQYPVNYKFDTEGYKGEFITNSKYAPFQSSNDSYLVSDSDVGILTQHPIKSIVNIEIPIIITKITGTILGATEEDIDYQDLSLPTNTINLDITQNVVEEEVFEKLTDFEKSRYFHYKRNSNYIDASSRYKMFLITDIAQNMILGEALSNYFSKYAQPVQSDIYESVLTYYSVSIKLLNQHGRENSDELTLNIQYIGDDWWFFRGVSGDLTGADIGFHKNARYRITYISETNSTMSSENENSLEVEKHTENNLQQQDRIISFLNFSNTLYSISQRTGTINLEITCQHFVLKDLIEIGNYTSDNYVCTKAEYIYYNNYIIGKYSFDKNYNRISTYMGINADIRQYEIPNSSDSYERSCEIKNYLEISRNNTYGINSSVNIKPTLSMYFMASLGSYQLGRLMHTNVYTNEYEMVDDINIYPPIKFAIITYNDEYEENRKINAYLKNLAPISSPALKLECFAKGSKNSFTFDFGFNHNIIAGSFPTLDTTGNKIIKQKIPYCNPEGDKIGFLRNISFYLSTDTGAGYSGYQPYTETYPLDDLYHNDDRYDELITFNDLMVLKDPAEILRFTYQLNVISLDDRINLGKWFFEHNYIFSYLTERVDRKEDDNEFILYSTSKEYSKYDIDKLKDDLIPRYTWKNSSVDGNLLLGGYVDKENTADFYVQISEIVMRNIQLPENTKTLIIANKDNIIMTIKYNINDVDESGENYLYKPIYFNFKDRRSDIKYEY